MGGVALPWWAKPKLEAALSDVLHRQVSIGHIGLNPYTLTATLDDLKVVEAGQAVLAVGHIKADLDIASIWRRGPVIDELLINAPYLKAIRLSEHQYNWSDLLNQPAKPASEPLHFAVHNIRLIGGRIEFDDRPLKQTHKLEAIELGVPFISNLPVFIDTHVDPTLAFKLDGAPFRLTGDTKPFSPSRESTLKLALTDLDIARYWAYLPTPPALQLNRAVLATDLRLVFRQQPAMSISLEGGVKLHDVALDASGQSLLRLKSADIGLARVEPLAGVVQLNKLALTGPEVTVSRDKAGELNWLAALKTAYEKTEVKPEAKAASAPAKATAKEARKPHFAITTLTIDQGSIDVRDATVDFVTRIDGIALHANGLDSATGKQATVKLDLHSDALGQWHHDGKLQLAPISAEGDLTLTAMPLAGLAPFYRSQLAIDPIGGTTDIATHYRFAQPDNAPLELKLAHLGVTVRDLLIKRAKAKPVLAAAKEIKVENVGLDLAQRQVTLDRVALAAPVLNVTRLADGRFEFATLATSTSPDRSAKHAAKQEPAAPTAPWKVTLQELAVSDGAAQFEDKTLAGTVPLQLKRVELSAKPLQWPLGGQTQLKLAAQAGRNGTLQVDGVVSPEPLAGKLAIQARQLDMAYAQPYFSPLLNITLASGRLSTKGNLSFKPGHAHDPMAVSYSGNANVTDFYALDKLSGEDFLKWKSLYFGGIDVQTQPINVGLKEIALTDFYAKLMLSPQGRLNLADIVVHDHAPTSVTVEASAPAAASVPKVAVASAPASAAKAVVPVRIGKITLSGGNINYTDNFVKPNYTANLTDMAGSVAGLSSVDATRATLDLRGSMDRIAPVTISGQLNPLGKDLFLDIQGAVKGYELTAASTYAAKYAGYGIEKGKLSMDVGYHIENGKLQAQNHVVLDQLTLGETPSGSPEATKLPVKFALSLLKDRRGQINVQLPVTGSLDDPQFSVGHIVWQAIFNVLTKIITSPFDALASAFGGGPQFSYVAFEPGIAKLEQKQFDGLTKLSEALADRPALNLDIAGWVDPELDREGLKAAKLAKLMRGAKAGKLADKGEAGDEAALEISAEDYPKLLEQVYKQTKFPKPKNVLGLSKSLPPEEMHKLLLANLPVTDDDLKALASQRALAVKDFLKGIGVPEARLFLVNPKLDATAKDGEKDKGPSTRAMFSLHG
uniref:DUF748 domain-containing protein n=1 Tax=Andreprevotia chitinilytica TaxID=396808 RepID=UPI000AE4A5D3|nr:DUF748 domain-containing protein [Andreprevotia chitinilytica]